MIMRWDPFRQFATLQRDINRLFDSNIAQGQSEEQFGTWGPTVDIREDVEKIVLEADLPGMKQEDIKINLENNVLSITGERNFEHEEKKDDFHRIERRYGSFSRSFTLPNTVETGKIEASYNNGVLMLTLPKREEVKPKQIEIKVK